MTRETAKYWVLANTNYLLIGIFIILSAVTIIVEIYQPDRMVLALLLSAFIAVAGFSFKDQSFLFNIPIAFLAGIAVISLEYTALDFILAVSLVSGAVISIPIARFANRNFSEIVSRRMRWRSSNVVLFEEKWKYVINRYLVCTFGICSIIFYVLSTPFSMSHPDLVHQIGKSATQSERSAGTSESDSIPSVQ